MHELASLRPPDGPFRTTEPVTFYKYMQQHWIQENQGKESDLLPANGQLLMAPEFSDTGKVYFYRMKAVDLWRTYSGEQELADMLRSMLKSMLSAHAKLQWAGSNYCCRSSCRGRTRACPCSTPPVRGGI